MSDIKINDINTSHANRPAFSAIHEVNVILNVRLWIGRTHSLDLVTARFRSPR